MGAELPDLLRRRGPWFDLIAALCGFALAKYRFRGRNILLGFILGGVLIPGTVLALPTYLLLNSFGLINTYWAVILPHLASPFGVFLIRIYIQRRRPRRDPRSRSDRRRQRLPDLLHHRDAHLLPSRVTVFLFSFISTWNNFFLPLIVLNDQSLWPVTLACTPGSSLPSANPIWCASSSPAR